MNRIIVVLKNISLLNLLLLVLSIILFIQLVYPMLNGKITVTVPSTKEVLPASQEEVLPETKLAHSDFSSVAEKNLFHPERKMPMGKSEEQVVAKPEIVLYGTLITSEKKIAYVEDKKSSYSTPGRGKRQIALSIGENISGYTLKEVNTESIVLVRGEDKLVVKLSDHKDRKFSDSATKQQMPGQIPIHTPPQLPSPRQVVPPQPTPAPVPQRPILNVK